MKIPRLFLLCISFFKTMLSDFQSPSFSKLFLTHAFTFSYAGRPSTFEYTFSAHVPISLISFLHSSKKDQRYLKYYFATLFEFESFNSDTRHFQRRSSARSMVPLGPFCSFEYVGYLLSFRYQNGILSILFPSTQYLPSETHVVLLNLLSM